MMFYSANVTSEKAVSAQTAFMKNSALKSCDGAGSKFTFFVKPAFKMELALFNSPILSKRPQQCSHATKVLSIFCGKGAVPELFSGQGNICWPLYQ